MINKNIIYFLLIILSGCSPSPLSMTSFKVPDGTPMFQEGYRDGCSTITGARSTVLYRMKYEGYHYNPDYIDNPEYKFGYGRGYAYCFGLTVSSGYFAQGASDAYILGRGTPFGMGRGNINDTVNYETGSWNDAMNLGGSGSGGVSGSFNAIQSPKGFSLFGSHPLYGTPSSGQVFGW